MIQIKVLGPGCNNCKRVETHARLAVEALGIQAEIIKITDHDEIFKYPILSTPGLVINEKVVAAGRIPTPAQIETWLKEAAV